MNAKTCKRLRKMAHQMHDAKQPVRKLMVHPAHEASFRSGDRPAGHTTAVNHPQSFRGIYRWLKRNFHYA